MPTDTHGLPANETAPRHPWMPFLWVGVASALAHLWCLGSQFYLDDMPAIFDSEFTRSGKFWAAGLNAWTALGYIIQVKLFGISPAAFHAVNWLLHTTVACVLFGFGRDFLRGRAPEGTALFAAMLFAVHPLASEIPNYARTQDLAWVTLFSLGASWGILRFMRGGGMWILAGTALCMAGATLSKGPGAFHVGMMAAVVALTAIEPGQFARHKRKLLWAGGTFVAGLAAFWIAGFLPKWIQYADNTWENPRFVGHAYTLARVFWEFSWRAVIPLQLCSDHQIAETMVPEGGGWFGIRDKVAMIAAAGMLALTVSSLFLTWRKPTRLFGACLFLFTATILFRVLYIVPEFMPEYRIYPGMPWFCLGAAIFLGALWQRVPGGGSPRMAAALILLPAIVLSARRSFVWHDMDSLCADVLKSYPAQGRAVWELHDRDMAKGDWKKIVERQQVMWPVVFNSFIEQTKKLQPARDLNSGHFALSDVACAGRNAIAIAHLQNPAAGMAEIRKLEMRMRQLGITEETNRTIWGYYHHARATILEMAGAYQPALESMRFEGVFKFTQEDIERVERKLAEKK